jgi:hypothetical protein
MASHSKPNAFLWASVLLPVLFAIGSTQLAYLTGEYPHVSPLAHIGIGLGILIGLCLFLWGVELGSLLQRHLAICVYVVFAVVVSYVVAFMTACGNGDCI